MKTSPQLALLAMLVIVAGQTLAQATPGSASAKTPAPPAQPWQYNLVVDGYIVENGVSYGDPVFTADHDWIRRHLAREMYIWAFNVDESDRIYAMTDPEVVRAVDAMPEATTLVQHAKKAMAARMR